ncbi:hypothetical protein [Chelativorans sp. AA-79]|nr:hypothetical protein [Chelativorans sp. AA-79]WEX10910.1 hypothetical protein PVE73_08250 [Chelativorans sp. AA-79]
MRSSKRTFLSIATAVGLGGLLFSADAAQAQELSYSQVERGRYLTTAGG